MSIVLTVESETIEGLRQTLETLLAQIDGNRPVPAQEVEPEDAPVAKPSPPAKKAARKGRPKKKLVQKDPVPEAAPPKDEPAPEPEPETESDGEAGEPLPETVTREMLRDVGNAHMAKHGVAATVAVLEKYGAMKLSALDEMHYRDVYAEFSAALES